MVGNLPVFHMISLDKRLFRYNLELTLCRSSESEDS